MKATNTKSKWNDKRFSDWRHGESDESKIKRKLEFKHALERVRRKEKKC